MPPGNAEGARSLLVQVDLQASPIRVEVLPTAFRPHNVVATPSGDIQLIDEERGLTSGQFIDGRWIGTQRRLLHELPDGIVAAIDDNTLVLGNTDLWAVDLRTRRIRWMQVGLGSACVAAASRGKLICGLQTGEILELSSANGGVLRTIRRCPEAVSAIAVDRQRSRLASVTEEGRVEVCTLQGRLLWAQQAHGSAGLPFAAKTRWLCGNICFSPDGYDVITAAEEGRWGVAAWDAQYGERVQTLYGHRGAIHGFTHLPDGTLVTWASDGTLRLWDTSRGYTRRAIHLQESTNA
jgi:WD40 repeat protein